MGIFDDLFKKDKSNEDPMDAYINAHPSSRSSSFWGIGNRTKVTGPLGLIGLKKVLRRNY